MDIEEDIEDETGVSVRIPLDEKGADILLVTPSADFFAEPHIDGLIGYAKVFHQAGVSWTIGREDHVIAVSDGVRATMPPDLDVEVLTHGIDVRRARLAHGLPPAALPDPR